jgi:hypothetical protein
LKGFFAKKDISIEPYLRFDLSNFCASCEDSRFRNIWQVVSGTYLKTRREGGNPFCEEDCMSAIRRDAKAANLLRMDDRVVARAPSRPC